MIAHTDPHNYHRPMKTTPTPHDALFKNFMTQPAAACDLLEFHLPPELRQLCDLSVNYGLKMSHSYALKVRHFKTGF